MITLTFLILLICCNAQKYGWLKEGTIKNKKVLINVHDKVVELVYDNNGNIWRRAIGSTAENNYQSVGKETFMHRSANYFRDKKKNKNVMAIWIPDPSNDHKAKFKWVYQAENEQEGEKFVKQHNHDMASFDFYMTDKQAKVQRGCNAENWINGPPIFGWLVTNECMDVLRFPPQKEEKVKDANHIIMKRFEDFKWYNLQNVEEIYVHLTHHFFTLTKTGINVQFMYDNGKLEISGKPSSKQEEFAQLQNTHSEYIKYIVKQKKDPPKQYLERQSFHNMHSCGVIAINNFAGYKLFGYKDEKKAIDKLCESLEGKTALVQNGKWKEKSSFEQKEIEHAITNCIATYYGDGGLEDKGFEYLVKKAGWGFDDKIEKYGPYETWPNNKPTWDESEVMKKFKKWGKDGETLGFMFGFFRYGGFGSGHWLAIRRFVEPENKNQVKWRKIDGAGLSHGILNKGNSKKKYSDSQSSVIISKHDRISSEIFTVDELFEYVKEKYNENVNSIRRYERWGNSADPKLQKKKKECNRSKRKRTNIDENNK